MLQRQDSLNFRHRKKLNRLKAFFVISLFFLTGCGLDVVKDVYADPVTEVSSSPAINSLADAMIFNFNTRALPDSTNMGSVYIYYKIYNSESEHNNAQAYLSNMAADENRNYASASTLLGSNYKFVELYVNKSGTGNVDRNPEVFLLSNEAHKVSICLYAPEIPAEIKVDEKVIGTSCRKNGKSFNFFEQTDENKPDVLDDDFKYKSEEGTDSYYVALYSVFSAFDDDYTPLYSPIHYLGSIKISRP